MVNNMDSYQFISDIHNRSTRQGFNLIFINLQPIGQYISRAYYMAIKVFNNLPVSIKQLYNNPTDFKLALKKFLCVQSYYTLDEYFDYRHDKNNVTIHL
jgi:hypothetical protein